MLSVLSDLFCPIVTVIISAFTLSLSMIRMTGPSGTRMCTCPLKSVTFLVPGSCAMVEACHFEGIY